MAKLTTIEESELTNFFAKGSQKEKYCAELEAGNILFFPKRPFDFPQEELEFLLAQRQTGAANRKNIAYKPQSNKITNALNLSEEDGKKLLDVMQKYSQRVTTFLTQLLSPYAEKWRLDYASFRPFQEKGRKLRTRARNDLLHVDSFPTRPMHGSRILRFFTNINPTDSRFWTTSDPFADLAAVYGGDHAVRFPGELNPIVRASKQIARKCGLPVVLRSPYDVFMLNLHNYLKENDDFQKTCRKDFWEFPPNCCWAVYTDQVSHAATAGQYALEQTLIIPRSALVHPENSPVSVLEKMTNKCMVDPVLSAGH